MYVLLTGASAYALLLSYKATFASAVDRLKIHSKKSTYSFKSVGLSSSEEFNAMVKNNVIEEASAWTFLFCNACYSFTFAFLAFYAFRNVEVAYSYTVSTAAAAAATFYLSTLKNN
jgi:multidrug transporter EmrE-like cation transporter